MARELEPHDSAEPDGVDDFDLSDPDDWEAWHERNAYDSRSQRLGSCKVCGGTVIWWTTNWRHRVPLDPIPLLDIQDHLPGDIPASALFVPTGSARVVALRGQAGRSINVYRLHNDGECIRRLRAEASQRDK